MPLNAAQVAALLKPIHPSRVLSDNKGMAHVSQQDVRAHLTRVFGFGGWSSTVTELTLVSEGRALNHDGTERKGFAVTYRARVRLDVRDPAGNPVCSFEDVATGTSPNLPTLGDSHDFACKVAVSMALKRAATNLGDGFGLSLYNKGQRSALVIGTLVMPDGDGQDVQDQVPAQVSLGHDDAGSSETPAEVAESSAGEAAPPPVSEEVVSPSSSPDPDRVAALRQRVLDAMQHRNRGEALQMLTRISMEAGQEKLMEQMTMSPSGTPMTMAVLLDEAIKHRTRSAT